MIEFDNISKIYPGKQVACENINLTINDGEFVCLIGTSGSGKTTCMRMINRMVEPSSGKITIDGKNIRDVDPVDLRRKIGYVIQENGLMPHMTVYENIVTVPRLLGWPEDEQREIAERLMKEVDLPLDFFDKYPSELSGGQQQRVGVIRALAANQNIVLMDEPFGALDPITKLSMQRLVKRLHLDSGKTIVFVTHDMDEALNLADKIVILKEGHLVQVGSPEEILLDPKNDYVKDLIGEDKLEDASNARVTIGEIMYEKPIYAKEDTSVIQCLALMREKRVDTVYVTNGEQRLLGKVGIFNASKLANRNLFLKDVLEPTDPVHENMKVIKILDVFYDSQISNLPVVNSKAQLVGIVTRSSLVDFFYENIIDDGGLDG